MKKQIKQKPAVHKRIAIISMAVVLSVGSFAGVRLVSGQSLQEQINELSRQNSQVQAQVSALEMEAADYRDAINKLTAQIEEYQRQIDILDSERRAIEDEILAKEQELTKQRDLLGQNIKVMYMEGNISTIEMLATSKNLSDYLDKQQYRTVVKNKIKNTVDRITQLKAELQAKKREIEQILTEQQYLKDQTAAQRAEQNRLLGYNQAQQREFNNKMKENQARISELKRQQAIENARLFGGGVTNVDQCGPNYPAYLCNRPMDSMVDPWGMYNRQCVSYVAYMVATDGIGGTMPYWGGRGNAWQWGYDGWASLGSRYQTYTPANSFWHTANAKVYGKQYIAPHNVQRGDVAVKNGVWGHVMYVESVNPNGTINISQFNHDWTGRYSEAYNVSTAGLVFIRF